MMARTLVQRLRRSCWDGTHIALPQKCLRCAASVRYPCPCSLSTTAYELNLGSFLPVTLEQLARERGVLYSDKSTPCIAQIPPNNGSSNAASLLTRSFRRQATQQCMVTVLGIEVTTASFAMYTFSIAVFVQALVLVSFSSVADHGSNRKRLLLAFAIVGGLSSMSFMVSGSCAVPIWLGHRYNTTTTFTFTECISIGLLQGPRLEDGSSAHKLTSTSRSWYQMYLFSDHFLSLSV